VRSFIAIPLSLRTSEAFPTTVGGFVVGFAVRSFQRKTLPDCFVAGDAPATIGSTSAVIATAIPAMIFLFPPSIGVVGLRRGRRGPREVLESEAPGAPCCPPPGYLCVEIPLREVDAPV